MGCLKSCDQDQIARIPDSISQMMQNPPAFAHSRCGDHHEGNPQVIQSLALRGFSQIAKPVEPEWVLAVLDKCGCFGVKFFRVAPEYIGDVDRQRTIDEDGDIGKQFSLEQAVQD
jgi:hypothetical protein